jgi:hypothetical protein
MLNYVSYCTLHSQFEKSESNKPETKRLWSLRYQDEDKLSEEELLKIIGWLCAGGEVHWRGVVTEYVCEMFFYLNTTF